MLTQAYRRAGSVDVQESIPPAPGHKISMNVGWIATGEWLQYSTFVAKGGKLIADYCVHICIGPQQVLRLCYEAFLLGVDYLGNASGM